MCGPSIPLHATDREALGVDSFGDAIRPARPRRERPVEHSMVYKFEGHKDKAAEFRFTIEAPDEKTC
jgi:hypothetical protein